jgi:hypothetical protein
MKTFQKLRFRLSLDVEVDISPVQARRPSPFDNELAELCARVQAVVLANRQLLDQHLDLELAIFLDTLDRDEVKRMLGWDGFDPYQHPESLLDALSESDSEFLRAAQIEQRLGEFLGDLTDSFQAELTGAVIERLK